MKTAFSNGKPDTEAPLRTEIEHFVSWRQGEGGGSHEKPCLSPGCLLAAPAASLLLALSPGCVKSPY